LAAFSLSGSIRLCRHYTHSRTRWSQSRESPQVLRSRREKEFVFGAAWPPQPQAPEPKDALEVGKQHLNLFPAATSSLIFRCRGESPGNVAGIFVQITWNLAGDRVRAATRLEFTNVTIRLAGALARFRRAVCVWVSRRPARILTSRSITAQTSVHHWR
jgi:hypothetical protein